MLRIGAEQAVRLGLARLQAELGDDRRSTWMDEQGALRCAGPAPFLPDAEGFSGMAVHEDDRWTWRSEDFSQDYDEAAAQASALAASAWARSANGRQKLMVGPLGSTFTPEARRALELGDKSMFEAFSERDRFSGRGWGHFGLLTDPVRGGFRADLSEPEVLSGFFGAALSRKLAAADMAVVPAAGIGVFVEHGAERRLSHLPVLADFRLSLGLFNSRSDGRHRLRFHMTGLWWNPSSLPLIADAQHHLFLIELTGAPEVEIRNLDSGAGFRVSLDRAPLLELGALRQTLRDQGLWCWSDVPDRNRYGMSARGLLPGEVFSFQLPSGQPQGLARILTAQTWRYDDAAHGPAWRRPSANVFLPDDRIRIDVRFPERMSVRLRRAGAEPDRDQGMDGYPGAVIGGVSAIPFPDFQILTSGKDYSREDSKGYVISERRACLRLRLRPRPLGEWLDSCRFGDIMRPEWNLERSDELAEWSVDNPLLAVLDEEDFPTRPSEGVLWDSGLGTHDAEAPSAFACLRLRDLPLEPRVSVGAFRHMEPGAGRLWLDLMDRAFLSAPLVRGEVGAISHNPRLVELPSIAGLAEAFPSPAASRRLLRGAFNVNSRSVDAWRALLGSSKAVWEADAGGPFPAGKISGVPIFMLPSGAGTAQWAAPAQHNIPDSAFFSLGESDIGSLSAAQSMREVGSAAIGRLAEKIVELQLSHGWPYGSLQAFAASGLLRDAIGGARINDLIPPGLSSSRLYLREDDLLELLAPILAVRGDTFRVVGRAESSGVEALGGSCEVEFVVQRIPGMHEAEFLGRRFRIVSGRIRR